MPDADRMLTMLRRAIDHVRLQPSRDGHLVTLQECDDVLVAGDLHGHIPNFKVVLQAADLEHHPRRHLVLQELIHGQFRYPNGGERSHQLVDLFTALCCQYPGRVHYLPGNHELAQWTQRPISKGDESLNQLFINGVNHAYGEQGSSIYQGYMDLFATLPLAIRTPNDVFLSHTLPNARMMGEFDPRKLRRDSYEPADLISKGFVYNLLWGRDVTLENVSTYLRKVDADFLISGHIPTNEGVLYPNEKQIIVDCSASPASYILIPTNERLTMAKLKQGVVVF